MQIKNKEGFRMKQNSEINPVDIIAGFMEQEKKDKLERYKILNNYVKKGQILFVGSSLMEQFPIYEFIQDYDIRATIYNRGVGGFTTADMLTELDHMVYALEPSKIFINIGTNDLNAIDYTKEGLMERYKIILTNIMEHLPDAKIYVMAYYPINGVHDFNNPSMKEALKIRTNTRIQEANEAVEALAISLGLKFINVNRNLYDSDGNLKYQYSIEGMHMYANGYRAILDDLMIYVLE